MDAKFLRQFKEQIHEKTATVPYMVLDFNQTSFIDSFGLGFLMQLWLRSQLKGKGIYAINMKSSLKRFLKFNRVWDIFKPITCEDIHVVFNVLENKQSLPSFYTTAEAEPTRIRINLFGRLDADRMSNIDMDSIKRDIGDRHCFLNLKNLEFVDSSGLIFFLKIQKHLSVHGKVCEISEPTENVHQMLCITKLDNLFKIATTGIAKGSEDPIR